MEMNGMQEILKDYEEGECEQWKVDAWREYYAGSERETFQPDPVEIKKNKVADSDISKTELALYFLLWDLGFIGISVKIGLLIIGYLLF